MRVDDSNFRLAIDSQPFVGETKGQLKCMRHEQAMGKLQAQSDKQFLCRLETLIRPDAVVVVGLPGAPVLLWGAEAGLVTVGGTNMTAEEPAGGASLSVIVYG